MVNGVTRTGIAERVGEIEVAKGGGGKGGGGKRSNHDEMADRGWGPVCTEYQIDGKGRLEGLRREFAEWSGVAPRYSLSLFHPSRSTAPPASSPLSLRSFAPSHGIKISTKHYLSSFSVSLSVQYSEARSLCERYMGRRTARSNLWCFCETSRSSAHVALPLPVTLTVISRAERYLRSGW